jgi:FKBP-type peptidyl-prolyl cis-trans isomerase FkpA
MKLGKNNNMKSIILGRALVIILCLALGLTSCSKDDETEPPVPPRDRTEQQAKDKDSLIKYLESHYYNSDDFLSNMNPSSKDLIITKLLANETVAPSGQTLLIDAVEIKTVEYEGADYEFYILRLNQGGGEDKPMFSDNVLVDYEGFTLDNVVFDGSVNPVTFDLAQLVPGWRKVLPDFNTSETFADNIDGTVNFMNHGSGVMFLPSGLGYFANTQTDIPAYSPIIFKFDLYQMYENDFDGDGIPSYLEDLTDDGEFTVNFENSKDPNDDDTDGDFNADYADSDDDGDGILTINEISITTHNKLTRAEVVAMPLLSNQVLLNKIIKEQNGTYTGKVITFPDTDLDGIPDYLDR